MPRTPIQRRLSVAARLSATMALTAGLTTVGLGTVHASSKATESGRLTLLSGMVLSPDGRPVADDKVIVYPADSPADVSYPMIIGSAMTDAQGQWLLAVPSWPRLPADSQAAADGNGGWLNVIASAFGVGGGFEEEADGVTAVWTGTRTMSIPPAGTTAPRALTMTMSPLQKGLSSLASARGAAGTWAARASVMSTADAYATPPTDKYGYQSAISPDPEPDYSPFVAPGGVNLAKVPVKAGVAGRLPKKCRTDSSDWKVETKTVHNGWGWTKVGEYHTYWRATGGFDYTVGANSSISVEVSADGLHFHADKSKTYHNDASDSMGIDNGPYDSHQVVLSMSYREKARIDYPCVPGTFTCYKNVICAAHYWVEETGLHNPGNGWVYMKEGANVGKFDGYLAFEEDAIDKYWNGYQPNSHYSVTTGHGIDYKYGASVSLGPLTVSVESETDHNTDADQSISFESRKTRFNNVRNKRSILHEVWGSNHKLTNIPGPAVFYNY